MGRIFLFATPLYGYGDPGFNGHRPASLDRPLRDFHFAVNSGAATCSVFLLRSTTVCQGFACSGITSAASAKPLHRRGTNRRAPAA
jgi:hypothetical protein